MTEQKSSVGAAKALEVMVGESGPGRWVRPLVRNWGTLFLLFVLLLVWIPALGTPVAIRVRNWMLVYLAYLLCIELVGRFAPALYENTRGRLFRIQFNLAMIAILLAIAPPAASAHLWFFFAMPLLATAGYLARPISLLIVYVEICAALGIVAWMQGSFVLESITAVIARDLILGLVAGVIYFFVHLFPRLPQENLLVEAAGTLLQTLGQRDLCQLLADAAKTGIPASDAAVVHLVDREHGEKLIPMGSSNIQLDRLGQSLMEIGIGIAGHAIAHHETINVDNVHEDQRYHRVSSSPDYIKSLMVAPMYVGQKNVGSISVHSARAHAFGERDRRFLIMLATQGATALANAELYSTRARHRQRLADVLEASRAFKLGQSLDSLAETIATDICRCGGYQTAVIGLLDPAGRNLIIRGMSGVSPAERQALAYVHIPLDTLTALLRAGSRISQSYYIQEYWTRVPDLGRPTLLPDPEMPGPDRQHRESVLILPIETHENELLGYAWMADPVDRWLPTPDAVQALEILVNALATAVQNAYLYHQAQKEIAERALAERALAREQYFLQTFMDNVPDNIYFKDLESRFIRINKALAAWFGLGDPAQAIGKTDADFFTPEHAQQAYADEREVMRAGRPMSKEEKETWPDGRETWVVTAKMPLRDPEGRMMGTFGISKDVTERKQAEEVLQQRNRELALLNRAGQAFAYTLELDSVAETVLEEVRRVLDVSAESVWLAERGTEDLVCQQATGLCCEAIRGTRLPAGTGIAGWAARHRQSVTVADTHLDERHWAELDRKLGCEIRSVLAVPLVFKQDLIGVLEMVDTEADRFTPTDQVLVESLAALAASAIANARLYRETNGLRLFSENIVQRMEEGILMEDALQRIVFVNPRMAELLGYTPEELRGQRTAAIMAQETGELETAQQSREAAGRYETVLLTRQGHRVPVIVSATPLFEGESLTGVLNVYTDITDRKQQEARLEQDLAQVTSNLARYTSLEGLYHFIVESGAQLLLAQGCCLFLAGSENPGELELAASTAPMSGAKTARLAVSDAPGCGLVAYAAATCQPIRLLGAEIVEHGSWDGAPWADLEGGGEPTAERSILVVPMCLHDGQLNGVLAAWDASRETGFSEFDERLLRTLAAHGAADIDRVQGVARALEQVVRIERKRLEADLHEAMNVLATGVRWEAEILLDDIERSDMQAAQLTLTRLQAASARAYTDLRHVLDDLRDPTLEQEGLLAALRKRAEVIGYGRVVVRGEQRQRLPAHIEGMLYRVGQEAMANAVKHAGIFADTGVMARVWLEHGVGQVTLCVRDNGVGFDVESTMALSNRWGLRRLRDAVQEMGGRLEITSLPGQGTAICATLPLSDPGAGRA